MKMTLMTKTGYNKLLRRTNMTDVQNENELFKQRIENDHQNAQLRLEELRNIYKDNYDDYSYIWLLSTLNKVEKALSEAVDITNGWIPDDCDQTNIFDEQPESDPEPVELDKTLQQCLDELNEDESLSEEMNKTLSKEIDKLDKEPEELPEVKEDKYFDEKDILPANRPIKIHISDIFKKRG